MIRKGFVMSVNKGQEAEYERRHRPIWAELEAMLKRHSIHSYSIYLHEETNLLFAYVEYEDQALFDSIAQQPECKKWWAYMKEIMPSNPDNSPVVKPLREVFHIHK
jgi:L-rhamnose mutarotase